MNRTEYTEYISKLKKIPLHSRRMKPPPTTPYPDVPENQQTLGAALVSYLGSMGRPAVGAGGDKVHAAYCRYIIRASNSCAFTNLLHMSVGLRTGGKWRGCLNAEGRH